jgi:hypothetical protein
MSHRIGTLQVLSPTITIGPDSGSPASSPNTWLASFAPAPSPNGTKFVILHFTGAVFPASNRLEVDLGYDTDVFAAADGPDFWTRPIKLAVAGTVAVRYITNGGGTGHVVLSEYGRGEPMESVITNDPNYHNHTNPDLFLLDSPYVEPSYETRGFCGATPNWENIACVPTGDVRATVAQSVCIFVHVEIDEENQQPDLSSCSGTLIGPDLVLCAGHCVSDPNNLNPLSGSVCFDFQTNCDGTRPAGYSPRFYKVNKVVRSSTGSLDYSLLQLKTPVVGVATVPMRSDLPAVNDPVFEVHHPQAITKKISARHAGPPATISSIASPNGFLIISADTDLTGGSSGSALFDMAGRIIGIADVSGGCANGFLSITEVLRDIASTPPLGVKRDVMMVLDRSGSMSMDAGTGRTKIEEARDATSLFVQLIRSGAGDRIGMVSFSTVASSPVDFALNLVNTGAKNALIGPAPFSGGIVGVLAPGGSTTIGGGLEAGVGQFPAPGAGVNQRTILLMTDGLQNTPPMIAEADPFLAGADLSVIGFGTESNLNGVLLDQLAQEHKGLYTRAGSALDLKKFFTLAFGNVFEAGTLSDPDYDLPEAENSKSIPFLVCSDDAITAVLGWDRSDTSLLLQLKTPAGSVITAGSPGVEASSGRTWMFLRVALPYVGERDGSWEAEVFRPGGGEFPPPAVDVQFFVNVVVKGGPKCVRLNPDRQHYTGDTINPLVRLRNTDGTTPLNAKVKLTVTTPVNGAGNVLTQAKLGPATTLGGDIIPARQSTLMALEAASGKPAITYVDQSFDLFDDSRHEDGAMEPDGIFGNPLTSLLKSEGSYAFRAVATYGDTCTATREVLWTLHVDVAVDPTHTDVTVNLTGSGPGRQRTGTVEITPRDSFGNNFGPGRTDGITITGVPGTTVIGPVNDNGDGSYTVPVSWNPGSGRGAGVIVGQPGRPPVVVQPKPKHSCKKWKLFAGFLLLLVLVLLALLLLK